VRDVAMPRSNKAVRSAAAALQAGDATAGDDVAVDAAAPTTYALLQTLLHRSQSVNAAQPQVRGVSNAVRLWKEQKNARQAFDRVRDELTPSLADEMGDGGLLDNVEADNAKRYAAYGVEVADDRCGERISSILTRAKASRFRKKAKDANK
jgi:hypothetical protein